MQASSIGLALLAGVVTILSPCILPILPILMGRSLKSHRYGPLAMVLGLACSFAVMGSLLGFSAQIIGPISHWLRQLAIVFLLLLGTLAAFPKLSHRVFQSVKGMAWHRPQMRSPSNKDSSGHLWGQFLVGSQLGVVWIPCAGPTLGSILTLIAVDLAMIPGFLRLLAYALGAGIPMLAIAYGTRTLVTRIKQLYPHMERIQQIGGIAIALAAIGILLGWDIRLQLWLAPLFSPVLL